MKLDYVFCVRSGQAGYGQYSRMERYFALKYAQTQVTKSRVSKAGGKHIAILLDKERIFLLVCFLFFLYL